MAKQPNKPLRRALDEERQRLATQAFPGDLAQAVLLKQKQPKAGLLNLLRYPALATAIIALGAVISIAFLQTDNGKNDTPQAFSAQPITPAGPAPGAATALQPPSEIAQTPPAQTAAVRTQTVKAKLPEIDRALLPVSRNSQTTWLAGPTVHREQLERHSKLAKNPNPSKRVRLSFSTPTRGSIDRTFTRTLTLKSRPKPQGTQNESV
ncbi:MAG: hypothetical protein AAGB26_06485 [Planctomycetota bacterium]